MDATAALHEAVALHQSGDKAEASRIYEQILAAAPDHADALHLLGLIEAGAGNTARGITRIRRAIELQPETGIFHKNLALILKKANDPEGALAQYEAAARLMPDDIEIQKAFGRAALAADEPGKAVEAFQAATRLEPDNAVNWLVLADVCRKIRDFEGAERAVSRVAELEPEAAHTAAARGLLRLAQKRWDDALPELTRAVKIAPDNSENLRHLATAQRCRGHIFQGIDTLYRSIRANPDNARAHCDLAIELLAMGRYKEGFREYEWRIRADPQNFPPTQGLEHIRWDGSDPAGKTILILPEQGAGDAIQFVRFTAPLAERGARVLVGAIEPLKRLFGSIPGSSGIMLDQSAVAQFDLFIEAGSLPHLLGATIDTLPSPKRYLSALGADRARWKKKLSALNGFRVGVVWAGNPMQADYKEKSVPAELLAPLFTIDGVDWIALQVGHHANDLDRVGPGKVMNISAELSDFADTAAVIENLDLVIAIDTSVAHLAGALGRPVWTLLRYSTDWRWIRYETTSLWYRSMRLFWQNGSRRWEPVIDTVKTALAELTKGTAP